MFTAVGRAGGPFDPSVLFEHAQVSRECGFVEAERAAEGSLADSRMSAERG